MSCDHFSKTLTRELNGHNVSRVARELSIPKSLLHDWLNSRRGPSLSSMHHVKKLADYLELSFEELILGRNGPEAKTISKVTFNDGNKKYAITITKLDN